jgi:hypothetical protein
MFVVRVIRHQLGTMAAALRALVALVVISSFAHIDAFSPAPALWGVGKSSVMGSRTLGRSGMRLRGAKMAVSQDVDQELKAKQEAEMKSIWGSPRRSHQRSRWTFSSSGLGACRMGSVLPPQSAPRLSESAIGAQNLAQY